MTEQLEQPIMAELSRLVTERMGIFFPRDQWRNLLRSFARAADDLGFADVHECARWFIATNDSRALVEKMASYLTIGETYFLREKQGLEILEQVLIPEIMRQRSAGEKRLRIWSVGCASGEEPYCLAILLHRMGALRRDWDISILATDINLNALNKARDGIYTEWSFRNTPAWFKKDFFTKLDGGRFELIPEIRRMVHFTYFNLTKDTHPLFMATNAVDVILCRNVLMYFPLELAKQAVERLRRCMVDGGWLLVSPCELSMIPFSGFAAVNYPNVTVYRKQENKRPHHLSTSLCDRINDGKQQELDLFVPCCKTQLIDGNVPLSGSQSTLPAEEQSAEKQVEAEADYDAVDPCELEKKSRIYADKGKLDEALQLVDMAIKCDKLRAGLHYLRAMILQEQGTIDEAFCALRQAIYLDHDMVMAHFDMGNLALQQGRASEACKHYSHALKSLACYEPDDELPGSDGLPAGRLEEVIQKIAVGLRQGRQR